MELLNNNRQPSGTELLEEIENFFGWEIRWALCNIIEEILQNDNIQGIKKNYLIELIDKNSDYSVVSALGDKSINTNSVKSTLDYLLEKGQHYRKSDEFIEMIDFMGKFRRYSPYNNMLVKIQNPHCSFYATKHDWENRFKRNLKEDAKPMLILAPMHPVMLVYDLDATEGEELPKEITDFGKFQGEWRPSLLQNLMDNANKYLIRIGYKKHSSTSAGFAAVDRESKSFKMRISIHKDLDEPSRFGVLCHELAHIFLGHLGSDTDRWWPSRQNLNHQSVEIEAEAVAYLVTKRLDLEGSSITYLASYLTEKSIPDGISIDYIGKVAGKIEEMAKGRVAAPKRKK
ncbi:hypothetical protein CIB95_08940 [Lottiidibacillus patelloidae]|uniref:IrrE N-terminal-like domain-containing protein n=1 Tax=Lottiidibacillus patelloidae TaxID=2670334 RepID=A0A263BUN3_9BACI|nr:hypothetical protein CIB95_08940 [Lottiidibacillus patelloidae]